MSTYQAPVDFRTFDSSDMWLACKGFRSVIHRAIYTADVELAALLRGHLQQLLDIDEDIEDREGFAFAAGAALAHQTLTGSPAKGFTPAELAREHQAQMIGVIGGVIFFATMCLVIYGGSFLLRYLATN